MSSSWERHNQAQQGRQKQRQRMLYWGGGILSFIICLSGLIYLLWPQTEPIDLAKVTADVTDIEKISPTREPASTNSTQIENHDSGYSSNFSMNAFFTSAADARQEKLDRLQANLNEHPVARFQYAQHSTIRGPQQVEFTVSASGSVHKHAVGLATYAPTDIVGAANEWQVRPWWRLGWLPTTVDCGEIGTAAIGGHVSWLERSGPLHDLGALQEGDQINCQARSGIWYTYEVYEMVQIGYENTRYYWKPPQEPFTAELSLFSCKPELTGIIVARARLIER